MKKDIRESSRGLMKKDIRKSSLAVKSLYFVFKNFFYQKFDSMTTRFTLRLLLATFRLIYYYTKKLSNYLLEIKPKY